MMENIKDYGILNSSQMIADSLISAIRLALPAAKNYMEARVLKTVHPRLDES